MNLDFTQIKQISCGAVAVEQTPEGICFHRFTEKQRDVYQAERNNFYKKTFATAGVRLSFRTNSKTLSFAMLVESTCRQFFAVDVCVNGQLIGSANNYKEKDVPAVYSSLEFPIAPVDATFALGEGSKTVTVHLPWNMKVWLQSFSLDDGADVEPVKPGKTLIAYGDSITHGYDALHPANRYIARLADALDAQEFNKAIGGERFFANLAAQRDAFDPDYIIVAYGTNDWRYSSQAQFARESTGMLANLSQNYPNAKIFVISPIWRKIYQMETAFSSFFEIDRLLREETRDMKNVTVIKGFDFVPPESRYFADGTVHPTDEGFEYYFRSLLQEIEKTL